MIQDEDLLSDFNSTDPFSKEFEVNLADKLKKQVKNNYSIFLKPGQIAKSIWHLRSGYIAEVSQDTDGRQTLMDIYCPGAFVTDLPSFFHKQPVAYKYMAIGRVEVHELKQIDYLELEPAVERAKLESVLMSNAIKLNDDKSEMFLLAPRERIISFFNNYDVPGLADKYCASFLRISIENYIKLKISLLKSGEIDLCAGKSKYSSQPHYMQVVLEIKTYINENYGNPEFENLTILGTKFNTTKKTLTEYFKKVLGTTAYKYLTDLRMAKARDLLVNERKMVKEVYKEVGFKTEDYFSRRFNEYHGYPAKEAATKNPG
ncbi:helix-turn-helix domain-containing protein [Pedobacter sp. ASV1-7]|uniref:helix-turn-helix domain-containing protein n=1 Tax=Pedobacter sp. ASV1-7 TaxID=3145237 RepID=UPI0032E92874